MGKYRRWTFLIVVALVTLRELLFLSPQCFDRSPNTQSLTRGGVATTVVAHHASPPSAPRALPPGGDVDAVDEHNQKLAQVQSAPAWNSSPLLGNLSFPLGGA